MSNSPAFQFYPKDFLSDINVASMSMEERGIYITLLSYCWIEGCLKGGSKVVQAICNHPQNWDEIWDKVGNCFYEKDGNFHHKRLEIEKEKQVQWREKSRLGGIKSGKIRRQLKGGSQMVEPKGNSSSSSLSINKEKKEKKKTTILYSVFFEEFWKLYPKKNNKKRAYDEWLIFEFNNKQKEREMIITALIDQIEYKKLKKEAGEFVAEWQDPERWIKNRRWEDETTYSQQPKRYEPTIEELIS